MSNAEKLRQNRAKVNSDIEIRNLETIENAGSLESYYEKILNDADIDLALEAYKEDYSKINEEFLEKTKLQGADIPILFVAVALQCLRIYVINKITEIEKANKHGGKEDKIHEFQDKIFEKLGKGKNLGLSELYSSFDNIITMRGVPYDATRAFDEEIKKLHLFKGANHRFATLGHDPLLGLVFGTANILTNTITTNSHILIRTNVVIYDDLMKNPKVGVPIPTATMLKAAGDRFKDDKKSVAAAIIKQLIHIATDLYTPAGIPLPGASLVLNRANTEKLTQYVSSGDLAKIGASAGTAALINVLISAIHGCKLLFDGDDDDEFAQELYQARTKKVIMYSNCIASASNLVTSACSSGKNLDIGGLLITITRLFSDTRFLTKLEYEYINSGMSKIYEDKYADIALYY